MPNYVTNILEFDCTDEEFREIAEFLRGDNKDEPLGHVDFNVLIPMPEALSIESGSVGERGYEAYASFMMEAYGRPPEAVAELEAKQILHHGQDTVQTRRREAVGEYKDLIVQRYYQADENNQQVGNCFLCHCVCLP